MHHIVRLFFCNKKTGAKLAPVIFFSGSFLFRLFKADGLARANVGASTALDAEIRVDGISSTFRDSFLRAFANASATCGAKIRVDFVSHFFKF